MRCVYFNTGFTFNFGSDQSSLDILYFGGQTLHVNGRMVTRTWASNHFGVVEYNVRKIENDIGVPNINFNDFEPTKSGTARLLEHIEGLEISSVILHHMYRLGAIIFHQLHYHPRLSANHDI